MNTRNAILTEAIDLVQTRGYNAFSFQDIANTLGIKKASIHYHFPTKEALGLEIVKRFRDQFSAFRDEAKLLDKELARLDAFINLYKPFATQGVKIDIAGALGAEINTLSASIQEEMKLYFDDRLKWLKEVLNDALYKGEFYFVIDPETMAYLFLSTVQGALQIARTNQRPDYYFTTVQQLRYLILNPSTR